MIRRVNQQPVHHPSAPVRRFKTSAFVAVAVALLLPRYADLEELRGHPFSPPAPRFKTFEPVALFLPISADSTTSLCVHPFSPPAPRFKTPELVAVAVALFLPISADSTSSARIPPRRMFNKPPVHPPSTPVRRFRTSARVAVAVALLLARYADLDKLRVHPFSPPAPRFKSFEPVAVAVALFLPISADSTTSVSSSSFLPLDAREAIQDFGSRRRRRCRRLALGTIRRPGQDLRSGEQAGMARYITEFVRELVIKCGIQ
ncbi:hypothetical protein B0H11DRAFT_2247892 [Mycena galericulata]|nr:hypothetical protein B0H11DRAFT_2247892 [Mycena galericulata]